VSDWPVRHHSTPAELQARLAAERDDTPFIELRDGDGTQHLVPLEGDEVTVGRSQACGIALPWDAQVSRSHASIEAIDGVWTVLDDGRSTNGTFVNEERVQGDELTVSIDTVKTHMRALFDAFHLQASAPYRKRFELVRIAIDSGLVPRPERR
jgi:pSer/pThr/pTyr-binding forkhead associated (FHA) protein